MAKSIRISSLVLASALVAMAVWAASAGAEVVYSVPAGEESTGWVEPPTEWDEFGSLVHLGGTARESPKVTLGLQTNSEESFELKEMTLKIYAVAADSQPGPVLDEKTVSVVFSGTDPFAQAAWIPTVASLPSEVFVTASFDAGSPSGELVAVTFAKPTVGSTPEAIYVARNGGPLEEDAAGGPPGLQPSFTIEAQPPATLPPSTGSVETAPPSSTPPATAAAAPPAVTIPSGPSPELRRHKMKVSFPQGSARLGGPGALVLLKCEGSAAARCMGTLTFSILGQTHKVPFSISKGRRQYVVVPLGDDLERIDSLRSPRAVVTASTLQERGGEVRTERVLKLA